MIVAGNWKMNQNSKQALEFFQKLQSFNIQKTSSKKMVLLIPPAYFYLTKGVSNVFWGGQNCFCENKGPFTGEISPQVMKEMGASYCLVGHSERRTLFKETSAFIKNKFDKIIENQMTPILCVGENLEQKKQNQMSQVLGSQLEGYRNESEFIVAYEPLWAIGTGECADSEHIQEAFIEIRKKIQSHIPILYGGSVHSGHVESLLEIKDLGGFLVGKSSLDANEWMSIYNKC